MIPSRPHPLFAFEQDDGLTRVPLAARRAIDLAGEHLSLEGWESLPPIDRQSVAEAGVDELVDAAGVRAIIARAAPAPVPQAPRKEPSRDAAPASLLEALGPDRPLLPARWAALSPLARYALTKLAEHDQRERLLLAYDEIFATREPVRLTHLDERGAARMVDITPKQPTARRAVASSRVHMSPEVLLQIHDGRGPKGDVLGVARVAGIMAAKKTPELIPLCHGIALTRVEVNFTTKGAGELQIEATAEAFDRTGVEMEAMVAASVAALTVYDMIKAIDRWATLGETRLEEKSGGKSGTVVRGAP